MWLTLGKLDQEVAHMTEEEAEEYMIGITLTQYMIKAGFN